MNANLLPEPLAELIAGSQSATRQAISTLCQRHGIRKLSLFGSVLGDRFAAGSDIDILVEFEPGRPVGLRYFTIERDLADLFGRPVDLNTAGFLSPDFRDEVVRRAEVLYDASR